MSRYNLILKEGDETRAERYETWNNLSLRLREYLTEKQLLFKVEEAKFGVWDNLLEIEADVYFNEILSN
jgi:hypothetical protein